MNVCNVHWQSWDVSRPHLGNTLSTLNARIICSEPLDSQERQSINCMLPCEHFLLPLHVLQVTCPCDPNPTLFLIIIPT